VSLSETCITWTADVQYRRALHIIQDTRDLTPIWMRTSFGPCKYQNERSKEHLEINVGMSKLWLWYIMGLPHPSKALTNVWHEPMQGLYISVRLWIRDLFSQCMYVRGVYAKMNVSGFRHVCFRHAGFRLAARVFFAKRMVRDFNLEDHVQYMLS